MNVEQAAMAIIGDIHGEATKLSLALDRLLPSGRRLIFVGDYIDRGPDSQSVLDILSETQQRYSDRTVLLRGNHEAALLAWLQDGDMSRFIRHGGLSTIKSYEATPRSGVLERFKESFPKAHYDLLSSTSLCFQDSEVFVSHAGFDPYQPSARNEDALVLGRHGCPFDYDESVVPPAPLTVFGHFVQENRTPRERPGLVCVDTGCGTFNDGPLTAFLLPEHTYVQF
jgi:serine/threonine protein phosphatase 1